jgi:hypothetical protein
MPGSYEDINYNLRPAKTVERKMLCEAFRRLSEFGKVENYRYVGFGSTYFSDFVLFHKALGITNMLSIERDLENMERFLFNRPFGCIEIEFGESTEVLAALSWPVRTILWLDYDGKLDANVLADVQLFSASAPPGSVIVVTVNAHPDWLDGASAARLAEHRLQQLEDRVGREKIPADISGKDLQAWGVAGVCRRIVENEILETLVERNGGLDRGSEICYAQLFNFNYADGAKMLTVGGLLYDEGQSPMFARCEFENLSFVRMADEPYLIQIPSLTYREIRYLDTQLPTDDCAKLDAPAVPPSHVEMYARVYRYFPTFTEAEL